MLRYKGFEWFSSETKASVCPVPIFAVFFFYQDALTSVHGDLFLLSSWKRGLQTVTTEVTSQSVADVNDYGGNTLWQRLWDYT